MSIAYVGGKFRQSKIWAPLILQKAAGRFNTGLLPAEIFLKTQKMPHYLEPFCGGGSMLEKMAPQFERVDAGDANEDLIEMWKACQRGETFPNHISKQEWQNYKDSKGPPSALRAFAGFGNSFYGIYFASYFDGSAKTSRGLARARPLIENVSFRSRLYSQWEPEERSVVYCDPPYRAKGGFTKFDSDSFWDVMRKWRDTGCLLFISEYEAPPDFTIISELDLANCSAANANRGGKNNSRQKDRLWM